MAARTGSVETPDQLESLLAITDIARTVHDFRPLGETMELICQRVVRLPPCDWVTISLLSDDSEETTAWGDPGIRPEFFAWSRARRPGRKSSYSPVFLAISSGRPVVIADVNTRPDLSILQEGAAIQGFRAVVYVPIVARGRAIGTLNCYAREPHIHTEAELDLLRTVARLVGVAVETAVIAEHHRAAAAEVHALSTELAERNDQLSNLTLMQVELAEALLNTGADPLHTICELLASQFGGTVLIYSYERRVRAQAGAGEVLASLERSLKRRDLARLARAADGTAIEGHAIYRIGREPLLGWLLVHEPEEGLRDEHRFLIRHACALIGFEIESERADRTMADLTLPTALLAVTRGRPSESQLADLASIVLANGVAMRLVFVTTVDDRSATQLARRLNRHIGGHRTLRAAAPEERGIMVLFEGNDPVSVGQELRRALASSPASDWSAAISEQVTELGGLPGALEHARSLASATPAGSIAIYDELGPAIDLLRHLDAEGASAFVDRVIGSLIDYDRMHRASLVPSIAAYIENKGSLGRAAKGLGIHPNTLQLRLGRASHVMRADLHDPEVLGLLALAIKWHRVAGPSVRQDGTRS